MSSKVDLTKCVRMNGLFHDFCIGDLYNKNTEKIVVERPLWDNSTINNRSYVKATWNNGVQSSFKYSSHNTANTRFKNLEVDKSLQLSIALGFIEGNIFTEYINSSGEATETNPPNVDINCKWFTSTEFLTETAIQNLDHNRSQEEDFTHIVVAIQHGRKFILSLNYQMYSDHAAADIEESVIAFLKGEQPINNVDHDKLKTLDNILQVTNYSGLDLRIQRLADIRSILDNMKKVSHCIEERALSVWLMPKQHLLKSIGIFSNKTEKSDTLLKSELLLDSNIVAVFVLLLDQLNTFIRSVNDLITKSSYLKYINMSLLEVRKVTGYLLEQIKDLITNYRLNNSLPETEFVQILKYLQLITRSDSFMTVWLESKQNEVDMLGKVIQTENVVTIQNEFITDLYENDCIKVVLKQKLADENLINELKKLTENIKNRSLPQHTALVNIEQVNMDSISYWMTFIDQFRQLAVLNSANNRIVFYLVMQKAEHTKVTIEYYVKGRKLPFTKLPPILNELTVHSQDMNVSVQWTLRSDDWEKSNPIRCNAKNETDETFPINEENKVVIISEFIDNFYESFDYEVTCYALGDDNERHFEEMARISHSNLLGYHFSTKNEGWFQIKVQPRFSMMDLVGIPLEKKFLSVPSPYAEKRSAELPPDCSIQLPCKKPRRRPPYEEHLSYPETPKVKRPVKDCLCINGFFNNVRLGSLYDRRNDAVLRGLSLWDENTLRKPGYVSRRKTPSQDWKFEFDHSISKKMNSYNIEGGLKLSLMSGLLDLQGSAKYLTDSTDKENVASVSLIYNQTTVTRELTQKTFKHIDNKYLLENNDFFTHVIIAIQYGGKCTMLFEKELIGNESKKTVGGKLKAMIKGVPIGGELKVSNSSSNDKTNQDVTCKVRSDIPLDKVADDLETAMKLYKSLPTKLNANNIGVPVWIWLMPKQLLSNNATAALKMVPEISDHLIQTTISVIEGFLQFIARCKYLVELSMNFPSIQENIKIFKSNIESFKTKFQNEVLKELIVDIRRDVKNQNQLRMFFDKLLQSPFDRLKLNRWLDITREEIDLLETYRKCMENENTNIKLQLSSEFETSYITTDVCVVLTIQVAEKNDPYLQAQQTYLQDEKSSDYKLLEEKSWCKDEDFIRKIRLKIIRFIDFANANKDQAHCIFVARSVSLMTTEKNPNVYVNIYKKGLLEISDFDLNSIHADLCVWDRSDDYIRLHIKYSDLEKKCQGSIFEMSYEMECEETKTDNEYVDATQSQPKVTYPVEKNQIEDGYIFFTNNLQPKTNYIFTARIKYVNSNLYGCNVLKKVSTYTFKKPMNFKVQSILYNQIQLSSRIPPNAKIDSYEIRCKEQAKEGPVISHLRQWTSDTIIIECLKFDTTYEITVRACNEDQEVSGWSDECIIRTNPLVFPEIKSIKFVDQILQVQLEEKIPIELTKLGMHFKARCKRLQVDADLMDMPLEYNNNLLLTASKLFYNKCWYEIQLLLFTGYGSCGWNCVTKIRNETETENASIQNVFDDDTTDPNSLTNVDIALAIDKMQIIAETTAKSTYPDNKVNAVLERLQRIVVGDTDGLFEQLCWMKDRKLHIIPQNPHDILLGIFAHLNLSKKNIVRSQFQKNQNAVPLISRYLQGQEDENPTDILLECITDFSKPLISFVRFGDLVMSKSQLINLLLRQYGIVKKDIFISTKEHPNRDRQMVGFMEIFSSNWSGTLHGNDADVVNVRGDALNYQEVFKAVAIQSDVLVIMISPNVSSTVDLKCTLLDLHEELKRRKRQIKLLLLHDIQTDAVDLKSLFKKFDSSFSRVNYLSLKSRCIISQINNVIFNDFLKKELSNRNRNDEKRMRNRRPPSGFQKTGCHSEILRSIAKSIVEEIKRESEGSGKHPWKSFWSRLFPLGKLYKQKYKFYESVNHCDMLKALNEEVLIEKSIKDSKQHISVLVKQFLEAFISLKSSDESLQFLQTLNRNLLWLINVENEDWKGQIDVMDLVSEGIRLYELSCTCFSEVPISKSLKPFLERITEILLDGVKINLFDYAAHNLHLNWIKTLLSKSQKLVKQKLKLKTEPNVLLVSTINFDEETNHVIADSMFGAGTPILPISKEKYLNLRLVLLSIAGCPYQAVLLLETVICKSTNAIDSKNDNNRIAAFCLGVSDVAILNVSEKSYNQAARYTESVVNLLSDMRIREVDLKVAVGWQGQHTEKKEKFRKCLEDLELDGSKCILSETSTKKDSIIFITIPCGTETEENTVTQFKEQLAQLKVSILKKETKTDMDSAFKKIEKTWTKVYEYYMLNVLKSGGKLNGVQSILEEELEKEGIRFPKKVQNLFAGFLRQ